MMMVSRDPYKPPTVGKAGQMRGLGGSNTALERKRTQSNHRVSSAKH